MLKNNKGVTLLVLVITITVMLILAGVTITTSNQLIKDTRRKAIISNMYIVKGKAEAIYDEYQFSEDNNVLKGTLTTDVSTYGVTANAEDLWYIWNKDVLSSLDLDSEMLSDNSEFIVNYYTGEVIYSTGVKDIDGTIQYTLTDMTK